MSEGQICKITEELKAKLREIGYEEKDIPAVVSHLCFATYRKRPKKNFNYLILGVDKFGLVDCGGDYKTLETPLAIISSVIKCPECTDWKEIFIFDRDGKEVFHHIIKKEGS